MKWNVFVGYDFVSEYYEKKMSYEQVLSSIEYFGLYFRKLLNTNFSFRRVSMNSLFNYES